MEKSIKYSAIILLLCTLLTGFTAQIDKFNDCNSQRGYNSKGEIKFTILYDNYSATQQTKSDWGFACLIEGIEKTILFDTGTKGDFLINNIDKLGIDVKKIDLIFISHVHGDHTGGIKAILQRNPDLPVYVISSFPEDFGNNFGIKNLYRLDKASIICKGVKSTGEMGEEIHEQSLMIDTDKGIVVVTGCSHQGIIQVLKKTKEEYKKDIFLVFGGFHLLMNSKTEVDEIIKDFKETGVQKCGATHCTGDSQINQFKQAFGENYIEMGVGRVFIINDKGLEIK